MYTQIPVQFSAMYPFGRTVSIECFSSGKSWPWSFNLEWYLQKIKELKYFLFNYWWFKNINISWNFWVIFLLNQDNLKSCKTFFVVSDRVLINDHGWCISYIFTNRDIDVSNMSLILCVDKHEICLRWLKKPGGHECTIASIRIKL